MGATTCCASNDRGHWAPEGLVEEKVVDCLRHSTAPSPPIQVLSHRPRRHGVLWGTCMSCKPRCVHYLSTNYNITDSNRPKRLYYTFAVMYQTGGADQCPNETPERGTGLGKSLHLDIDLCEAHRMYRRKSESIPTVHTMR